MLSALYLTLSGHSSGGLDTRSRRTPARLEENASLIKSQQLEAIQWKSKEYCIELFPITADFPPATFKGTWKWNSEITCSTCLDGILSRDLNTFVVQ